MSRLRLMVSKYREFWLLDRDGKIGNWAYKTKADAIHNGGRTASESFGVVSLIESKAVDDWRAEAEALYQRLQEIQSEGMDNHWDKMAVRRYEQFKKEGEDD